MEWISGLMHQKNPLSSLVFLTIELLPKIQQDIFKWAEKRVAKVFKLVLLFKKPSIIQSLDKMQAEILLEAFQLSDRKKVG